MEFSHFHGSSTPPALAIVSHKGGTGRSTTALALAYLWGMQGHRILLAESSTSPTLASLVYDHQGKTKWQNVRLTSGNWQENTISGTADLIIVDCPPLTLPSALTVLKSCDAAVLTCLPDPLSLRTLQTAILSLSEVRKQHAAFRLLGLVLNQYQENVPLHTELGRLVEQSLTLPLQKKVPFDPAIRAWMVQGGQPIPDGPGRSGFAVVAAELEALGVFSKEKLHPKPAPLPEPAPAPVAPAPIEATTAVFSQPKPARLPEPEPEVPAEQFTPAAPAAPETPAPIEVIEHPPAPASHPPEVLVEVPPPLPKSVTSILVEVPPPLPKSVTEAPPPAPEPEAEPESEPEPSIILPQQPTFTPRPVRPANLGFGTPPAPVAPPMPAPAPVVETPEPSREVAPEPAPEVAAAPPAQPQPKAEPEPPLTGTRFWKKPKLLQPFSSPVLTTAPAPEPIAPAPVPAPVEPAAAPVLENFFGADEEKSAPQEPAHSHPHYKELDEEPPLDERAISAIALPAVPDALPKHREAETAIAVEMRSGRQQKADPLADTQEAAPVFVPPTPPESPSEPPPLPAPEQTAEMAELKTPPPDQSVTPVNHPAVSDDAGSPSFVVEEDEELSRAVFQAKSDPQIPSKGSGRYTYTKEQVKPSPDDPPVPAMPVTITHEDPHTPASEDPVSPLSVPPLYPSERPSRIIEMQVKEVEAPPADNVKTPDTLLETSHVSPVTGKKEPTASGRRMEAFKTAIDNIPIMSNTPSQILGLPHTPDILPPPSATPSEILYMKDREGTGAVSRSIQDSGRLERITPPSGYIAPAAKTPAAADEGDEDDYHDLLGHKPPRSSPVLKVISNEPALTDEDLIAAVPPEMAAETTHETVANLPDVPDVPKAPMEMHPSEALSVATPVQSRGSGPLNVVPSVALTPIPESMPKFEMPVKKQSSASLTQVPPSKMAAEVRAEEVKLEIPMPSTSPAPFEKSPTPPPVIRAERTAMAAPVAPAAPVVPPATPASSIQELKTPPLEDMPHGKKRGTTTVITAPDFATMREEFKASMPAPVTAASPTPNPQANPRSALKTEIVPPGAVRSGQKTEYVPPPTEIPNAPSTTSMPAPVMPPLPSTRIVPGAHPWPGQDVKPAASLRPSSSQETVFVPPPFGSAPASPAPKDPAAAPSKPVPAAEEDPFASPSPFFKPQGLPGAPKSGQAAPANTVVRGAAAGPKPEPPLDPVKKRLMELWEERQREQAKKPQSSPSKPSEGVASKLLKGVTSIFKKKE